MKTHRSEPYFTFLKNGQKTIEGRLKLGKFLDIRPGDNLEVFNTDETENVKVVVKRTASYTSVEEMLTIEPMKNILPDVENLNQGLAVYRKFYTPEQIRQFGMIAIEVEIEK